MDSHFLVLVKPLPGTAQHGDSWLATVCGSDEAELLWLLMRDCTKVTDFCIVVLNRGVCPVCKREKVL